MAYEARYHLKKGANQVTEQTKTSVQRSLRNKDLTALSDLTRVLKLDDFAGDAVLHGADPLLRSPHHLAEATAYALLAEGIAAASAWHHRSGQSTSMEVSVIDAIHALHSTHFLWQSNYSMSVGAEFVPTNGIYQCKDGRYIMTESGPPYVKLERGYLNFFDCGNNRESIAREMAKYDAADLEEKLSALGLPACVARSKQEWEKHPQGLALMASPLVEIEKVGDGSPKGLEQKAEFPLDGIRVVDFTHVLAGPRSARSLAQYGAEVLHISSPYHRDTVAQNLLVNIGKRNAYLLLTESTSLERMRGLISDADVFVCSYRPEVAQRFGLQVANLVEKHQGLICVSINAYGHSGPWALRPGFDHNVQVGTGFAVTEGGADKPRLSPVFYLNDFLTGYLASAGAMAALLLRAKHGGSYHVKVSLARTAMWVQSLGYISPEAYSKMPEKDEYPTNLHSFMTSCGKVTELAPAVSFDKMPRKDLTLLQPFGADEAKWSE